LRVILNGEAILAELLNGVADRSECGENLGPLWDSSP
jgi:hypothetical protein